MPLASSAGASVAAVNLPPPLPLCPPTRLLQIFNLLGVAEFMPSRRAASDLFGNMCRATPLVCISVITAICGFNWRNVNVSRLPDYVQYAPSGTSVMNMAHWAQVCCWCLPLLLQPLALPLPLEV